MCFTKVKNIIDKTIKYNDSKTSGNFGPAIIITKIYEFSETYKRTNLPNSAMLI
jgi:hypothetical protein